LQPGTGWRSTQPGPGCPPGPAPGRRRSGTPARRPQVTVPAIRHRRGAAADEHAAAPSHVGTVSDANRPNHGNPPRRSTQGRRVTAASHRLDAAELTTICTGDIPGLLPRRAYAGGLIGRALVAAALGSGHRRIARDLAVPAGTVRGWIRGARRSAAQLRITGIRTVVAYDQDALPAWGRPDELGCALEHLGAAAMVLGRRYGLQHTSLWARINVLTRGRLLAMAPAG